MVNRFVSKVILFIHTTFSVFEGPNLQSGEWRVETRGLMNNAEVTGGNITANTTSRQASNSSNR